jgi:hypothetical protein
MLERIRKAVNWENREVLLKEYYHSGQSHEGTDAFFEEYLGYEVRTDCL